MRRTSPNWEAELSPLRARLIAQPWRLLHTEAASGAANMALDVALLDEAAAGTIGPTLRLYTWSPPAISLGRFQTLEGIDFEYARTRGWGIVRRPTGGRAVLHAQELTYSITLPPDVVGGAGVRTSYQALMTPLHAGIRALLGADAAGNAIQPPVCDAVSNHSPNCFALASECDTLVPQGKLVGSAQVRRGGALLQHGAILLDADPEHWRALFGTEGRLVSARGVLGRAVAVQEAEAAILNGFEEFGIQFLPDELTPTEVAALSNAPSDAGSLQG